MQKSIKFLSFHSNYTEIKLQPLSCQASSDLVLDTANHSNRHIVLYADISNLRYINLFYKFGICDSFYFK